MTVLGTAYVNIRAITDKLEADVRKAIDSINDNLTIKVDADVSSATAKLQELANSDLADRNLNVDADTTAAKVKLNEIADMALGDQVINVDADTTAAKAQLEEIAHLALGDQVISVSVDSSAAHRDLLDIANTASLLSADISVGANTAIARAEFSNMVDDMDRQDANVRVNLNDLLARVRMAFLTRTRQVRIDVKADTAPLAAIGKSLAMLSGARVATESIKNLVHEFANIDQAVIGISTAAMKIGTIGGLAMSSVAGVMTLGASLGSVLSMLALAGPGVITGFAVGVGTMMVALKDFGNQLPGVTAQYKTLGNTIKGNFWSEARASIGDMATKLFPLFNDGLAQTSGALGRWAASFSDAIKNTFVGNQIMPVMFENLAKSIDIAKGANANFVESMMTIGFTGSALLPRLATWWTDIADRFNNFIQSASSNGDLYVWIEDGIFELKRLGDLIGNLGGIFGGITKAAKLAGSDGLGTLLNFVTILNEAINAPYGINALKTIFEGAGKVSSALGDTLAKVFGGIAAMAPSISSAFGSVAAVIGLVGDALANILNDPQFQAGFMALFDGIQMGAARLLPIIGETGPKLGAFLSIIGNLAANIGGILGSALSVTLPLITAFKQAIDPLIPILGDALIHIIEALGPTFLVLADAMKTLAPAIAEVVKWAADLVTGFIDAIGPALPELAVGVLAFVAAWKAVTAVQGVMKLVKTGIEGVETAMKAWRAGMTLATSIQAGFNTTMLANPVALIIAGIVALVAVVIVAYNNVGWFKDFVDGAFKAIQDIIAGLVSFWNTNVIPMWDAAMKAAGDFFGGIGKWIGEAITNVQNFFDGFGKGAQAASDGVSGFFDGIAGFIQDAINNVIAWVQANWGLLLSILIGPLGLVIQWVVENWSQITDTIASVMNTISVAWQVGWAFILDIFTTIWTNLVNFFQPLTDLIVAIVRGVVDITLAVWQVGWDIISTIFIGIWTNLVRFFTPIIEEIVSAVRGMIDWIVSVWNATWQGISDFFTAIWNGIVAFVTPIVQAISDTITNIVNGIVAVWNTVWQAISDFFISIWNSMVAFYGPILQGIWDFIVSVGNGIAAAWNSIWSGISSAFSAIWNGITGFVNGAVNTVKAVVIGVVTAIQAGWNATWSAIGDYFNQVWNNIVSWVQGFVRSVQSNVQTALDTVGNIGSNMLNAVGNFGTLLYNAGADLIRGLANGITNMTDWVVSKVSSVGASVVDGLKNFFGIKSPSRLMRDQIGKQIGAGLAIGIEQSVDVVKKATQKLSDAAMMEVPDIQLPSIKAGSVIASGPSTAPLNRSSVFATDVNGQPTGSAFGQTAPGGVTNVNFQVNPSQGLNEQQIGEAAMEQLYWKLSTTSTT